MRKTEMRSTTLVDVIVVCSDLPDDEIEQIEAFSGVPHDAQEMAVNIISAPGFRTTCFEKETGQPLGVAGFIPIGTGVYRTFMLVSNRAWADHGVEITLQTRRGIKDFLLGKTNVRLETMCLASRDKAREWYPRVGLEYESTQPVYGAAGETAVLYTKTQKE